MSHQKTPTNKKWYNKRAIYRLHTNLRKVAMQAANILSGKTTKYSTIYVNNNS